jgi:hypothetical protein
MKFEFLMLNYDPCPPDQTPERFGFTCPKGRMGPGGMCSGLLIRDQRHPRAAPSWIWNGNRERPTFHPLDRLQEMLARLDHRRGLARRVTWLACRSISAYVASVRGRRIGVLRPGWIGSAADVRHDRCRRSDPQGIS